MADLSLLRITVIVISLAFLVVFYSKKNDRDSNFFSLVTYLLLFLFLGSVGLFPKLIFDFGILLSFNEDERAGFYLIIILLLSFLLLSIISTTDAKDELEKNFIKFFIDEKVNSIESDDFQKTDLLILIPSFNEIENIKDLLKTIPKRIKDMRTSVLVIDDGSTDNSVNYLKTNKYYYIRLPFNSGQGTALKVGYKFASLINVKYVVTMDADNQHLPSDIHGMLSPLILNEADVVIGSRILGNNLDRQKIRSTGISFFSLLIYLLTKVKIHDISSGFRCFKLEVLEKIDLQEPQYQSAEFILSVLRAKFKIIEVPINFNKRKYGKTKKGVNFNYALGFFKSISLFFLRR